MPKRKPLATARLQTPLDYFRAVFDAPGLTLSEKLVLLAMLRHNRSDLRGWSFPGDARLTEETALSRETVRQARNALTDKGWLVQTFSGKGGAHGKANAYELSVPRSSRYVIGDDPEAESMPNDEALTNNPNSSMPSSEISMPSSGGSMPSSLATSASDFELAPRESGPYAPAGVATRDPSQGQHPGAAPQTPQRVTARRRIGYAVREDELIVVRGKLDAACQRLARFQSQQPTTGDRSKRNFGKLIRTAEQEIRVLITEVDRLAATSRTSINDQ